MGNIMKKEDLTNRFARGYLTDERYQAITDFLLDIQTRPDYYTLPLDVALDIAYLAGIGLMSLNPSCHSPEEVHDE